MDKQILIIDTYSVLRSAFYGVPEKFAADGSPIGGLSAFDVLLQKVEGNLPGQVSSKIAACWNGDLEKENVPETLTAQMEKIRTHLKEEGSYELYDSGVQETKKDYYEELLGKLKNHGAEEIHLVLLTADEALSALAIGRITVLLICAEQGKRLIKKIERQAEDSDTQEHPFEANDLEMSGQKPVVITPAYEKIPNKIITTAQAAMALSKRMAENGAVVSAQLLFDEPNGREIYGISLCFDEGESYLLRLTKEQPQEVGQMSFFDLFPDMEQSSVQEELPRKKTEENEDAITEQTLTELLTLLSRRYTIVTFDSKNLYHFFEPEDKKTGCFDVQLAAYLLNPLNGDYKPEQVAEEIFGIKLQNRADLFGKSSFSDQEDKKIAKYGSYLVQTYRAAMPVLKEKLEKARMLSLFTEMEMPLTYVLYDMEKEGIIVKREELKAYGDRLTGRIQELEDKIQKVAGQEFNINSPKQLGEVLFEQMGLPGGKKTKSGFSTAADVLEKLAPDYPIVKDILEYRGLAKLKSTYADGLADYIGKDGRIHTTFKQTVTATGRLSSAEPNLQNIPMRTELGRLIRKVFVPKEGYIFADADYSQIELRILAHMSEDPGLIEAYQTGQDIHRSTASKVFHTPFEEVTSLQRRNAKAVNFGIVYGISAFGLANDLNISRSEAQEYMDEYLKTYPGVKSYQDRAVQEAKEHGYAITLFGRRRPMPELSAGNYMQRQFGERVAMNAPIQGTAADIMKIAMLHVWERLRKEKLKSKLILQIHDELVIETAPEEKEAVEKILTEEMAGAASLAVPLEAECNFGTDWFEAK